MIGSLLPWIIMSSHSLIFKGALHLCFAVSERASEIPSCYIISWLFWESVVIRDLLLLPASWLCHWYGQTWDLNVIVNMVVHDLCWKLECWLYMFATTRSNRVCKSFSLSLSVCQLNCLTTNNMLSLVSWYVSVVSTFPSTFALVLDSNLHDLNGTNPNWRCFQQNCHGVIFVQK